VNTGVVNTLFTTGCTIADLVAIEAAGAGNHGEFVSGVAHLGNALFNAGIISEEDKDRLQRATARSTHP
jgi:hypothetical protein